ncbi:MAG: hypothetical protein EOP21_11625 [Hyphomicrobiales bacterium]|nr:MAG: hypothetical protein EOP21_11625 [Hyphomicrobiales bacterium]
MSSAPVERALKAVERRETMTTDVREKRFYVIDENDGSLAGDSRPLGFDEAFGRATSLTDAGRPIKILCTGEAAQAEITLFVSQSIATELASGG